MKYLYSLITLPITFYIFFIIFNITSNKIHSMMKTVRDIGGFSDFLIFFFSIKGSYQISLFIFNYNNNQLKLNNWIYFPIAVILFFIVLPKNNPLYKSGSFHWAIVTTTIYQIYLLE